MTKIEGLASQLSAQTLGDQALEAISEYIARLEPGDQLPGEGLLAENLGVSRPVVREALKTLAGMGAIEMAKGRVAVVRPITSEPLMVYFNRAVRMKPRTIIELVEVRCGLELEAVGLATQRRTDADVAELRELVTAMRATLEDLDSYARLDVRLHFKIAEASGNAMLCHLVESVEEALRATIDAGLRCRRGIDELRRVQEIHEQIVDAVASGDPVQARIVMRTHFDEAVTAIVERVVNDDCEGAV